MSPVFSPHRGPNPNVLALVLAGGEGRRLWPLTADRAKPSVPIGGRYRLIDFVLSNLVNSGFLKIKVLTQYMSDSLNSHIARGWRLPAMLDQYVEPVPAQQRRGREWFKGSADAIFQSLNVITDEDPDYVMVFGGDHVYKMDVQQMLDFHRDNSADCTVACIPVPVEQAKSFGIIEVDASWRILSFTEKPDCPREIPGRPGWALASMGNYIFNTRTLIQQIVLDAETTASSQHDFGRNILPDMVGKRALYAYDFMRNDIPGMDERERGYWRDVGTIQQYFLANLDFVQIVPVFNLYNPRWPLHTWVRSLPPAKFVFNEDGPGGQRRVGFATNSLVSEGCIVSGGHVDQSVLGPRVRINSFAQVEQCILHESVDIGRHCRI
ncbi:MAG TPA: glucose-1-phosphate adenylyltransferase, partial [Pseudomonadota bacterium]|nr:glucose-1-phosphate adenylyltransferase [Pseudomonadota bacterium]